MKRRASIFFLTLVAAMLLVGVLSWMCLVNIKTDEAGIVSQQQRVVRQLEPGPHFVWPLGQDVTIFKLPAVRRVVIHEPLTLSDGSTCPVTIDLIYRISDPARAYVWRVRNGLDVLKAPPDFGRSDYKSAEIALTQGLGAAARLISPEAANTGSIETWLKSFRPKQLADGTRVVDLRPRQIACSKVFREARLQSQRKRKRIKILGPVRPLSRHIERMPVASGSDIGEFGIPSQELVLGDGQRVQLSALLARYLITDRRRFENHFGRASRVVTMRISHLLQEAARDMVRRRNFADLEQLDPLEFAHEVSSRLDKVGIKVVDIGSDDAGYQQITYKDP